MQFVLTHDVADVSAHCVLRDIQLGCNYPVLQALSNQLNHFPLASGGCHDAWLKAQLIV
jgi:hypothetical protein